MYIHVYVHKDLLQCAFFFLVQLFVSPLMQMFNTSTCIYFYNHREIIKFISIRWKTLMLPVLYYTVLDCTSIILLLNTFIKREATTIINRKCDESMKLTAL